jgi:CRISPR/Cas system-associated endonuclease Cas1
MWPNSGFFNSVQYGKPSLVCDFQEIYRYLIDDFVIQYCQKIVKKDFTTKDEATTRSKRGKREYINDLKTKAFMDQLNGFFESYIEIPKIKVGERQTIETLINEEALLFAKYLRDEIPTWVLRIAVAQELLDSHPEFLSSLAPYNSRSHWGKGTFLERGYRPKTS